MGINNEEFMNNVVQLQTEAREAEALVQLEESAPALYHLMVGIQAQLAELLTFKREMEEAINGIQSSGMLGMVSKLLK